MGYKITSESQYINLSRISKLCNELKSAAEGFSTSGNSLDEVASNIGTDAFAVDGEGINDDITETATEIKKFYDIVKNIANDIVSEAVFIKENQVKAYESYLSSQKPAEE